MDVIPVGGAKDRGIKHVAMLFVEALKLCV